MAGRSGLAHYSLWSRKWKLFGNESQEKDFVVTGGILWWHAHLIVGCFNVGEVRDELRLYPRDYKLDNAFVRVSKVTAQVLLLSLYENSLAVYCADSHLLIYKLELKLGFACK